MVKKHIVTLGLMGICVGACVSTKSLADRHFEAGAYTQAIAAYESQLKNPHYGGDEDRVLYRLGLLYLFGASNDKALQKAKEHLLRLIQLHPSSPYRHQADILLGISKESHKLLGELRTKIQHLTRLEDRNKQLRDQLDVLWLQIEQRADELMLLVEERDNLTQKIEQLEGQVAEQKRQLVELEKELSALKKIDMQRSP